jgi:hypothetical protein
MATKRGNPIKGSECDPKGATVGLGTDRGRAVVALGAKKGRKGGRGRGVVGGKKGEIDG